jgi:hypothetical protein
MEVVYDHEANTVSWLHIIDLWRMYVIMDLRDIIRLLLNQ